MEVKLVNRETDHYTCSLDSTLQQEETLEVIVPDTMPDVCRVLFVGGNVLMRSKEASDGRVHITGVANLSAVYLPEEGGRPLRVEAALPFSAGTESPEIRGGDRIIAVSCLTGADARAVNPRKLVFRADILTRIRAYGEQRLCFACPEADTEGLELLLEKRELELTADVREKTFVISEEFLLPEDSAGLGEILKSAVTLKTGEMKAVGDKLIFKGEAAVALLYTDGAGTLCSADLKTEFSQVMEMAGSDGERRFDVHLMLTGAYFEAADPEKNEGRILAELHLVAQAIAREKKEIEYVADAYCPRYALETESCAHSIDCVGERWSLTASGSAAMQTPTVPAKIIASEFRPGRCRMENGKLFLAVSAAIVYLGEDGGLTGVTGRFELSCDCAREGVPAAVELTGAEIAMGETGFALRLSCGVELEETGQQSFTALSALRLKEDEPQDLSQWPSLVLARSGEESLWSLAKRCHSSRGLILAANGLEELPPDGRMLLVPKMR